MLSNLISTRPDHRWGSVPKLIESGVLGTRRNSNLFCTTSALDVVKPGKCRMDEWLHSSVGSFLAIPANPFGLQLSSLARVVTFCRIAVEPISCWPGLRQFPNSCSWLAFGRATTLGGIEHVGASQARQVVGCWCSRFDFPPLPCSRRRAEPMKGYRGGRSRLDYSSAQASGLGLAGLSTQGCLL